jgi:gamma-glutamyl-gamma-aminobutyrate hydrolase PuuD
MKRVAITYHDGYDVTPYADAARDCGLDPVLVTPARPLEDLTAVHGLMLCGGPDLDPALYGQEPHPTAQTPVRERDALEQRLLREALAADLPVLAICRGMQLLNVTLPGGTLLQDIDGHRVITEDKSLDAHSATTAAGSRLATILGPGAHRVNSRHHQAVDRIGDGLRVSALAPDGIVEGIEHPDHRFVVGVQWHPENQTKRFPEQRRLFVALSDVV